MTYFQNNGVNVQQYVYDFSVDGGTNGTAISLSSKDGYDPLPDNALVLEVYARVITAVTSDGSATVEWGNTTDTNGYSGTAIAVATLAVDYVHSGATGDAALLWDGTNDHVTPFLANSANDRDFSVLINVADLTAGKIVFFVKYLYDSFQ